MIISKINGGIGNQLFKYAAGRRLALKLNTEFKLDISDYENDNFRRYVLNLFNTQENIAAPEEIQSLRLFKEDTTFDYFASQKFLQEFLNCPDNVYLDGNWESDRYFADIADVIRREFTLRNPLGATARHWREKILVAECSVSMHVRHGDFVYDPFWVDCVLPTEYYRDCLNLLRQRHRNFMVFVFSDNLNWCKENLKFDVPTEFVEGCDADVEELYLMSLCKHNVIANSTFSWWGAWLNQNPDKKVFVPIPRSFFGTGINYRNFLPEGEENSPLETSRWIRVPFDVNIQIEITQKPYFSILLVVNDDAATIQETLDSILAQDYKFFEVVIIDNASTDGCGKLCRQIARTHDNITPIKLWNRVSNAAAWNMALDLAQGNFVMFLKGGDKIFSDALTNIFPINKNFLDDVLNSVIWLRENESGTVAVGDRKFSVETDAAFPNAKDIIREKFDAATVLKILAVNDVAAPLGTKIFKREFLTERNIRFDENNVDAETAFITEAMLKAGEQIFLPKLFYVAPKR